MLFVSYAFCVPYFLGTFLTSLYPLQNKRYNEKRILVALIENFNGKEGFEKIITLFQIFDLKNPSFPLKYSWFFKRHKKHRILKGC